VNAGSRSAGVLETNLIFATSLSNPFRRDCTKLETSWQIAYNLDPIVLKSNEVFSKRVSFQERPDSMTKDRYLKVPVPDRLVEQYQYLICISFNVMLPDGFMPDIRFPLYEGDIKLNRTPVVEGKEIYDENVPFVIVRRWGTISQILSRPFQHQKPGSAKE
jgi:hypothetical protein